MEEYRNCPICFEVPEKEIYQCSSGHIICNLCIVNLTECPQCRTNYGATKVRSRVLEALLDAQEFECKFSDLGCGHLCKRGDISNHSNSCDFNLDRISLCELLEWDRCNFKLGRCSRAEILTHFKEKHPYHHEPKADFRINIQQTKAEVRESKSTSLTYWVILCSLTDAESSPLFLVTVKTNNPSGFMSFMCIQLWGMDSSEKYKAEFKLPGRSRSSASSSSLNSSLVGSSVNLERFQLSWTLPVYTIKEAEYMLKRYPLNIHVPALEKPEDNDKCDEVIHLKISRII